MNFKFVLFAFLFGSSSFSMAGTGRLQQGDALHQALTNHLIEQKLCRDPTDCSKKTKILGSHSSNHIVINMYDQKDRILANSVASFIFVNGINITKGIPITLRVFEGPKKDYMGLQLFSNPESIKLEIKK